MKSSTDRIITTHAGSLPRPPELLKLIRAKLAGQPYEEKALSAEIKRSVEAIASGSSLNRTPMGLLRPAAIPSKRELGGVKTQTSCPLSARPFER